MIQSKYKKYSSLFTLINALYQHFIALLNGMALGLFGSLIVGLLIKQLGAYLKLEMLVFIGQIAQYLMAPAIGAGMAYVSKTSSMGIGAVLICSVLTAGSIQIEAEAIKVSIGDPMGAFVGSGLAIAVCGWLEKKISFQMLLIPFFTIVIVGSIGLCLSPYFLILTNKLSVLIGLGMKGHPLLMSLVVSILMGLFLTLPTSSAAIAIILQLDDLAAGAATVGCASHMIGFAIASFKDNGFKGFLLQAFGTSMLQVGNVFKKPVILLPALVSSALLGPLAVLVFKMKNNTIGAGMGTCGLVGPLTTLSLMGQSAWPKVLLLHFILPAFIAFLVSFSLRKAGVLKPNDMKITSK